MVGQRVKQQPQKIKQFVVGKQFRRQYIACNSGKYQINMHFPLMILYFKETWTINLLIWQLFVYLFLTLIIDKEEGNLD